MTDECLVDEQAQLKLNPLLDRQPVQVSQNGRHMVPTCPHETEQKLLILHLILGRSFYLDSGLRLRSAIDAVLPYYVDYLFVIFFSFRI